MEKNAALAWHVFDLIQKNQEHLDMGCWVDSKLWTSEDTLLPEPTTPVVTLADLTTDQNCGTTACLAGWTAAVSGYTLNAASLAISADGERHNVPVLAAELLGLDNPDAFDTGVGREAWQLFYDTADADLEERITEVFGPRPEETA